MMRPKAPRAPAKRAKRGKRAAPKKKGNPLAELSKMRRRFGY